MKRNLKRFAIIICVFLIVLYTSIPCGMKIYAEDRNQYGTYYGTVSKLGYNAQVTITINSIAEIGLEEP